jgi:hypothetical protein
VKTPLALLPCLALVVPFAVGSYQAVDSPARPQGAGPSGHTATVAAAANSFLATLTDAERSKAVLGFTSAQRAAWSNLPVGMFPRDGLRLGDLTATQRQAAMALMAAALSSEGYKKVVDIMNADEELKNRGGGRTGGRPGSPPARGAAQGGARSGEAGPQRGAPAAGTGPGRGARGPGGIRFGSDEYFLALLGPPSATEPWMIQFGGHHLAINVTVVGRNSVLTPSLPATQPAQYTLNGQTIRPLGDENDKGFALINALTADQQKQAVLAYQVKDLVLGPGADGKVIQPEGIPASTLNPRQQALLLDVVHEWVGILNDEAATAKMAEIQSNLPKTWFAWSGDTKNGGLAYYRIQGPTVVIEYAPQQGDLEHIHTIYRDPTNDYGVRLVNRQP